MKCATLPCSTGRSTAVPEMAQQRQIVRNSGGEGGAAAERAGQRRGGRSSGRLIYAPTGQRPCGLDS